MGLFSKRWRRFWMHFSGISCFGKFSTRLASLYLPPYYGRIPLSKLNLKGYISPKANLSHPSIKIGNNLFIDDGVLIYQDVEGGPVELGDAVHIHRDTIMQTGHGGNVTIGNGTHIQPRCQFSAYKSTISIGKQVDIAPFCSFYPYDHSFSLGTPIRLQPLQSKGSIHVEDKVWIGVGVTVLDNVTIGKGAIVGAGSVVTGNLPPDSISFGTPACVVKMRDNQ